MGKFKLIAAVLIVMCAGCSSYQKQLDTYHAFSYAHPNELAKDCARQFPVKDSIGATVVDSTYRAINVDYTGKIDSLQRAIYVLSTDSQLYTVPGSDCAGAAKKYQQAIQSLSSQIKLLQQSYLPCKSDTVFKTKTVYVTDQAKLQVLTDQLKIKTDSLNITQYQLKDETKTANYRFWIIAGLLFVIVIGIALKVKNIL